MSTDLYVLDGEDRPKRRTPRRGRLTADASSTEEPEGSQSGFLSLREQGLKRRRRGYILSIGF